MQFQVTKSHLSSSLGNKWQQQSLLERSHKLLIMQSQRDDDDNLALQQELTVPSSQKRYCVTPTTTLDKMQLLP